MSDNRIIEASSPIADSYLGNLHLSGSRRTFSFNTMNVHYGFFLSILLRTNRDKGVKSKHRWSTRESQSITGLSFMLARTLHLRGQSVQRYVDLGIEPRW